MIRSTSQGETKMKKHWLWLSMVLSIMILMSSCSVNPYHNQTFTISSDIVDSNEIVDSIRKTCELSEKEYDVVSFTATLDTNHCGRWDITFEQKNKHHPNYVFVTVDTQSDELYNYTTASYDTKLEKGGSLSDCITGEEAIRIAEQELSVWAYSQIRLSVKNEKDQEHPIWSVVFDERYLVEINAETGTVEYAEDTLCT